MNYFSPSFFHTIYVIKAKLVLTLVFMGLLWFYLMIVTIA